MPTTVNGVGTHYYGKSNRQARRGVCRSCHADGQLESYDTTLWFVILFVPLIPLGRKRIIDQCWRCKRHFVANQAKYEMARQLNVSGALEQYRAQPTPEAALAVHASLLSFHMHSEAEKFRQSALLDHPQSAELHAGLAAHMQQVGRSDDSLRLLETAHALRPDLPDGRVGVARIRMGEGNLAEARKLLDFLEQPGAGQLYSLEPLETLAINYQKTGQHEETLVLAKHLLSELPKVGQAPNFRKFVVLSERAIGRADSVLPPKKFSLTNRFGRGGKSWLRRLTWVAALGGAALLVMAGMNEYWRRNRRVFAMNDCGQPVQLSIDGNAPQVFQGSTALTLAEGAHHVKFSGPINEEFDIRMSTGYFPRFFESPAWVIMAGRGTALWEETIHYAVHPRPGDVKLIAGKHFYYAPNVDYCFTAPPQKLEMDSGTAEVTKICLRRAKEPADEVIDYIAATDPSAALSFAETRLIRDGNDAQLLDAYVQIAEAGKALARAQAYLKAGLDRRPISVPWHRAYQDAGKSGGRQAAMEKQYDAMLKKSPHEARLLYLAGRIAIDSKRSRDLFRQAHDADPGFAWPCIALAYDAASCGDWRKCRAMAEMAAGKSNYAGVKQMIRSARLALGDLDALEQEARQAMTAKTGNDDLTPMLELCEVLAARNKINDARLVLADWRQRLPAGEQSSGESNLGRTLVQYMIGDFSDLQGQGIVAQGGLAAELPLDFLLAAGRVKDAVDNPSLRDRLAEPWNALAASIAWSIAGNDRQAASWREKAAAGLDLLEADSKRAAALLRAAKSPSKDQLDDVVLTPAYKGLLIAALIERFPQQEAELAPLARNVNVRRFPPYQLIRRVVEDAAERKGQAVPAP